MFQVTEGIVMYEENFCIKRIKELMKQNGWNSYRLSCKSGVSLSTLTSMFQKNTDPRVQTIEKICRACNISMAQFFERSSSDLTEEQKSLLSVFDSLPPEKKRMADSFLRFLSSEE